MVRYNQITEVARKRSMKSNIYRYRNVEIKKEGMKDGVKAARVYKKIKN